jgi:hypothetical protein
MSTSCWNNFGNITAISNGSSAILILIICGLGMDTIAFISTVGATTSNDQMVNINAQTLYHLITMAVLL